MTRTNVAWVAGILVWCALLGLLCGWLWMAVWEPASGQAYQQAWYPVPWEAGSKDDFAATGWFVLIAIAAGMITAILAIAVTRVGELVTLGAVIVGTCLASALMLGYGIAVAPPDPAAAAKTAADGTALLGTLAVPGWSARACLPLGAAIIFVIWYLMLSRPAAGDVHSLDVQEEQL